MNTTEAKMQKDTIVKALIEFHKLAGGVVGFDSVNPYYKSKYASLGAVIDLINRHAPEVGLGWIQFPVSQDGEVGIDTILFHESGERMESRITLPISTSTSKVSKDGEVFIVPLEPAKIAQDSGSVITYLRRYALASIFGLYADEDTDAEIRHTQETGKDRKSDPVTKAVEPEKPKRPYSPELLASNLKKMSGIVKGGVSKQDRTTIAAVLSEVLGTENEIRHDVQAFLFGTPSIMDAPENMVSAGLAWLKPVYEKENKVYTLDDMSLAELIQVAEFVKAQNADQS